MTHPTWVPDIAVVKDAQSFADLKEEWEELYRDSPLATPFQSWAWLYSWWEFYKESFELRIVTVRDGNLLVGLIPLMLHRRWGFGRLLFIGTGITDYLDALVREGYETEVSEAGGRALQQIDSWQVTDLWDVRPTAAAWNIFRSWRGRRTYFQVSGCPVVDVKPWNELLTSVSKNLRKTARRTLKWAEEDGVRCELAGVDDTDRAARRCVALHREMWQGRDIGLEHLTQRFESHLVAAARRMAACGIGGVSEFWRDGEAIVSLSWVFGHDFVCAYMIGASQEALERYQVSSLYLWSGVNIARDRNSACLDLGRGEESYKLRWSTSTVRNHRMILGRSLLAWMPYVVYHVLRFKAVQYVSSESTPQWIKSAVRVVSYIKRKRS